MHAPYHSQYTEQTCVGWSTRCTFVPTTEISDTCLQVWGCGGLMWLCSVPVCTHWHFWMRCNHTCLVCRLHGSVGLLYISTYVYSCILAEFLHNGWKQLNDNETGQKHKHNCIMQCIFLCYIKMLCIAQSLLLIATYVHTVIYYRMYYVCTCMEYVRTYFAVPSWPVTNSLTH